MKRVAILLIFSILMLYSKASEYPLVGHFQGYCLGVAKYGDYLYFNAGGNVYVAKQNSRDHIEIVNMIHCGTNYCYDIKTQGGKLFLALFGTGVKIYDLNQPEAPEYTGITTWGNSPGFKNSFIINDTILVGAGDDKSAFFDISDPSQPQYLSNIYFEFNSADAVTPGDNMYYGFSQEGYSGPHYLWAYDVSNPSSPSISAMLQISPDYMAPFPDCMGYSDHKLFVAFNDTVKIYDVSNPAEINYLTQFPASANIRYFQIKDQLMVCALSGTGVEFYDISDIYQPDQVAFYDDPVTIDYVNYDGDYLMLALKNRGCAVVSVSEQWDFDEMFLFTEADAIFGVKIQGNLGYFGTAINGYQIMDVFDAMHPLKLGNIDTLRKIETIEVASGYHFCSKLGGDDIYVVDVSDHWTPYICSTIETYNGFWKFQVTDDDLYIRENTNLITVYDVSVPNDPVLKDSLAVSGGQFFVMDSLLITTTSYQIDLYLAAYHITDDYDVELLSELEIGVSGSFTPRLIEMDENVIYVAIGAGMLSVEIDNDGQLELLDQQTWGNSGFYDAWLFLNEPNPFETKTMCISGNVLGTYYTFAIDVSDPENLFVFDTLPVSSTTLEPHNNLFYITRTYAGYDLYGDYVVNIPDEAPIQRNESRIRILPNPASGQTMIELSGFENGNFKLSVFDARGSILLKKTESDGASFRIDVSGFSPGVYIVNLSGAGISESTQMIIVE